MTANISRRRLIESSIVGTAALAGATSAFASKPVAKWDETVDIIVVGSGFAGLWPQRLKPRTLVRTLLFSKKWPSLAATPPLTAAF